MTRYRALAITSILVAVLPAITVYAQDRRVEELLRRVDSALALINTVEYHATAILHHASIGRPIRISGRVSARRMATEIESIGSQLRIDCTLEDTARTYVFDGTAATVHNHARRVSIIGDSASRALLLIAGGPPRNILPGMLQQRVSISDALKYTQSFEYLGVVRSGGIQCHRVRLAFPDNDITTGNVDIYDFAVADLLPRRTNGVYLLDGKRNTTEVRISIDRVNNPPADSVYSTSPLAGYAVERYHVATPPRLHAAGTTAPEWTARCGDGTTRSLTQFKDSLVLLDFWYTTCAPCIQAIPMLERINEKFRGRGVVVLGVNCFDSEKTDPAGFLRRRGATYPTLVHGEQIARLYNVSGYPTLYIIDGTGTIIHAKAGYGESVEEEITSMLNARLHAPDR